MAVQDGYEFDFTKLTVAEIERMATVNAAGLVEAIAGAVVGKPFGVDLKGAWKEELNAVQMAAINKRFVAEYAALFQ